MKNSRIDINTVKAVIFDLDGTLIDTEKIYRKVWPQAMEQLGYVFEDSKYLYMRSLGRPYSAAKFIEWYGDDTVYDEARKVRKVLFDAIIEKEGIALKKGAIELLEYLQKNNITTAIATATDPERTAQYMKMTGLKKEYFDRIISATMVDEGKPSPKVYRFACEQLGLEPEQCIAVEDAPNGVKSAYAAGLRVLMVPDQSQPEEELMRMVTAVPESLTDIIDIIK